MMLHPSSGLLLCCARLQSLPHEGASFHTGEARGSEPNVESVDPLLIESVDPLLIDYTFVRVWCGA